MATQRKHLRLSFQGDYVPSTLPGEIWEMGLRLTVGFGSAPSAGPMPDDWDVVDASIARTETDWSITGNWKVEESLGGATFNVDDWLNDQVAPAITTFMAYAHLSNQVRLRTIKCYPDGAPTGKSVPAPSQAQGSPILLTYTSAYPTGGESGTQLPPQDSIAVSTRTNRVGRRGHGRFYLPSATSASLSQGKVSSGAQADILAAAQTFLHDVSYSHVVIPFIQVRPIVTGAPYDAYGIVEQVRVGTIMDTQRRRRDRLVESYASGAVSY